MLPQPLHQAVHLQVNPRKRTWKGHTELKVQVQPGQQVVGLHCYNLTIHSATVNGVTAQYTLHQHPTEALPDPTVDKLRVGSEPVSTVSEYAYDQYLRLMNKEQEPELVITIPKPPSQQQQQSQAADRAPNPAEAAAAAASTLAAADGSASVHSAGKQQQEQQQADQQLQQQQLMIGITFSKPPARIRDVSLLLQHNCLVTNHLLRRSRGWFPCIDTPQYIYIPNAPHHVPYTFDLHVMVPPSFVAVCSGVLVQQTCTVAPTTAATGVGGAMAKSSRPADSKPEPVVMARTFEYAVTTPVVPAQLSIAVGPFAAVPYTELLAAAGMTDVALPPGTPVITVFALKSNSQSHWYRQQQRQKRRRSSNNAAGEAAAAADPAASEHAADNDCDDNTSASATAAVVNGGLQGLSVGRLLQLGDTLKPLGVLLKAHVKVVNCSLPWSHLQVAVLPEGTMMAPWQVGPGSLFLSDSQLVSDDLPLEPRLESAAAIAAALAHHYFGLLLLPRGPEDAWLLRGLAGWLQGLGLRQLVGSNELSYKRWQDRLWLSVIDDGEQLAPLSPQLKTGDRGATAAWGHLHGTQDLEPCGAWAWKATAVVQMLERRIGEDELRKVVERLANGAKMAATTNIHAADIPNPAAAAAASPATKAAGTASTASAGTPAKPTSASLTTAAPAVSGGGGTTAAAGSGGGTAAAAARVPTGGGAAAGSSGVPGVAAPLASGVAQRLMSTAKFMRVLGKKQGFRNEAPGFAARWLHGTGMPHLAAGVSWDNRRSQLLLALKQSGSRAVFRGAIRAAEPASVTVAAAAPVAAGVPVAGGAATAANVVQLKVMVRELDAVEEHVLQIVAGTPLSLHELKVSSKLGEQRRRQQRAASSGGRALTRSGIAGGADADLDVSEAELRGVPVLWVQIDPGLEWLAAVQLRQPAHWWSLQLDHSKDVVAQAQAVAGLAAQLGSNSTQLDDYIVTVLAGVMRNPGVFSRVRLDAALALGAGTAVSPTQRALTELIGYTRERLYDPLTGLLRPNNFLDLGEALLTQGLPAALAAARDAQGFTPEPVLALLLDVLACNDNSSNPIDDGYWLAALVTALGNTRLTTDADLARVLSEIDRQLAHEAVVTTHNSVLGCACLRAASSLAVHLRHPAAVQMLDQVSQLLYAYIQPTTAAGANGTIASRNSHPSSSRQTPQLKATAYACLLQVAAARVEAQLRAMASEAAAAAAVASVVVPYSANADTQQAGEQQQQWQQQAGKSYAQAQAETLLQQQQMAAAAAAMAAVAAASYSTLVVLPLPQKPPLLLDAVLGTALQLLDRENCPKQRAQILRETLLLIGQLEEQGSLELKPDAGLPAGTTMPSKDVDGSNADSGQAAAGAQAAGPATDAAVHAAGLVAEAGRDIMASVPSPPATADGAAAPPSPAATAAAAVGAQEAPSSGALPVNAAADGLGFAKQPPPAVMLTAEAIGCAAAGTGVSAAEAATAAALVIKIEQSDAGTVSAATPVQPAADGASVAAPDGNAAVSTTALTASHLQCASAKTSAAGGSTGGAESVSFPPAEQVLVPIKQEISPAAGAAAAYPSSDVAQVLAPAAAASATAATNAAAIAANLAAIDPVPAAAAVATAEASAPAAAAAAIMRSILPVSADVLLAVHRLVCSHDEPAVRQLVFMLLQKLAGAAATLYREREDEEEDLEAAAATAAMTAAATAGQTPGASAGAAAGPSKSAGGAPVPSRSAGPAPSISNKTGLGGARSSRPATSGGGISLNQTGINAPTRIKLGVKLKPLLPVKQEAAGTPAFAGQLPQQQQQHPAQPHPQQQQQQQAGSSAVDASDALRAAGPAAVQPVAAVAAAVAAQQQLLPTAVMPQGLQQQQQQLTPSAAPQLQTAAAHVQMLPQTAQAAAGSLTATSQQATAAAAAAADIIELGQPAKTAPATSQAATRSAIPPVAAVAPVAAYQVTSQPAAAPAAAPITGLPKGKPLSKLRRPASTTSMGQQEQGTAAPSPAGTPPPQAAAAAAAAAGALNAASAVQPAAGNAAANAIAAGNQQQPVKIAGLKRAATPSAAALIATQPPAAAPGAAEDSAADRPIKKMKFKATLPGMSAAASAAPPATGGSMQPAAGPTQQPSANNAGSQPTAPPPARPAASAGPAPSTASGVTTATAGTKLKFKGLKMKLPGGQAHQQQQQQQPQPPSQASGGGACSVQGPPKLRTKIASKQKPQG